MRIGDMASFWSYNGDEGDVHTGTLLAIHGERATIQERGRRTNINVKWIFDTWKQQK